MLCLFSQVSSNPNLPTNRANGPVDLSGTSMPATSIVYLKFKNHIADPSTIHFAHGEAGATFQVCNYIRSIRFAFKLRFYSIYSFQLLFRG